MLQKEIDVLKADITEAFRHTNYPGDDKLLHPSGNDDSDIISFYGQTSWQGVPDRIIEYENAALSCFSPEAFQFFLPRFMIHALEHYDSEEIVTDHTIYALSPEPDETPWPDIDDALLSAEEKELIAEIREESEKYSKDDDLTEYSVSMYSKLTEQQKRVIGKFLEFVQENLIEYFDEREVGSAIRFWKRM